MAVRCSSSAATYYGFYSDELNCYLFKMVAGTWTQLGSSGTAFSNGNTIRIEAEGTAIRGIVGGTTRISATDSAISSGSAGVCGYDDSTTTYLDGWSAGNIGLAAISGTASVTLAALTGSATGTVEIAGSVSKTLAALTGAATVALDAGSGEGSASVTLAGLTNAATGTVAIAGTASVTLAAMTGTATGTIAIVGAASVTLGAVTSTARGYPLTGACTAGVLTVDSTNARYLRNTAGIVFLAGFHTWYSAQDGGDTNPPAALDWDEYLDELVARGCNYTKLWAMETARGWSDDANQWFAPHRYVRTGPGNAADGGLKFDLTQINPDYLDRLEQRAVEAGNAGLYVCVQLWQGWQVENDKGGTGNPSQYHPYASANNINSIDGDQDNDGDLSETHQDGAGNVTWALQQTLVEEIIDRLNYLDNVIWEISNEDTASTGNTAWQIDLIDHIATYEAGKAKRHLIGMTVQWPSGSNTTLDTSGADWVSYNGGKADAVHAATDPASMYDTDHTVGLTSSRTWIFEALCNGHGGAWYMDEWDGALYGTDTRSNATYQAIRANLGYALDFAQQIDLVNAAPNASLASTGYCLAKTTGQVQVLAYQPNSGAFTVNLTSYAGTFSVLWLRNGTGITQAGSDISGGAVRTLTPPWASEDVAVFLELSNIDGAASVTLGSLTATATGTVALAATATATLSSLTGTGTATLDLAGAADATLASLTAIATGALDLTGAASVTLDQMVVAGTATVDIAGLASATLAALTSIATGELVTGASGAADVTLASLTGAATAVLDLAGIAAQTLSALSSTATGALDISGTADAALASLTGAATGVGGNLPLSAEVASTLASLTGAATAVLDLVASADVTLGGLTTTATGALTLTGTANAILRDATVTATGVAVLIIITVAGSVRGPSASGGIYGPKTNGSIGGN